MKALDGTLLCVNDQVGFRVFLSCSLKYEVLRIKRVYLDEERGKIKELPDGTLLKRKRPKEVLILLWDSPK